MNFFNFFKKKNMDEDILYLRNKVRQLTLESKVMNNAITVDLLDTSYRLKPIFDMYTIMTDIQNLVGKSVSKDEMIIHVDRYIMHDYIYGLDHNLESLVIDNIPDREYENTIYFIKNDLENILCLYKFINLLFLSRKTLVDMNAESSSNMIVVDILHIIKKKLEDYMELLNNKKYIHFHKDLNEKEKEFSKKLVARVKELDDFILYSFNNNYINYKKGIDLKPTDLLFDESGFSYEYINNNEKFTIDHKYIKKEVKPYEKINPLDQVMNKIFTVLLLSKYLEIVE